MGGSPSWSAVGSTEGDKAVTKPRHEYRFTVSVECPHGRRQCRPADEIMLNFMREVTARLAPYNPRVDLESHCATGESQPMRLDGEVVS